MCSPISKILPFPAENTRGIPGTELLESILYAELEKIVSDLPDRTLREIFPFEEKLTVLDQFERRQFSHQTNGFLR